VTAQAQKINVDIQHLHDDLNKQDLIASQQLEDWLRAKEKEILRIEQRIVQLENELKEQQTQAQRSENSNKQKFCKAIMSEHCGSG
jgi:DNA-binding transcriptional MerR regulator